MNKSISPAQSLPQLLEPGLNLMTVPIADRQIQEILRLGNARLPNEAGGLITPDGQVWELPNRFQPEEERTRNYELAMDDIQAMLTHWVNICCSDSTPERFDAVIWHTHPSGLIGPSSIDLEMRIPHIKYLVVSLPNGEAVRF